MMNVVDLFSGCGGLSLGFMAGGFRIVASFENWKPAIEVYRANFNGHPVIDCDLSCESSISRVREFRPDLIIGGPPCQDFSSAGWRNESLGRADLTIAFARIVAAIRPRFFVMENVDRIVSSKALKSAITAFKGASYGLTLQLLNANNCGVPQIRKRFFVIGELDGLDDALSPYLLAFLSDKPLTVREYCKGDITVDYYYRHPWSYKRRAIFSLDEPSPTIRGVNRPVPAGYPGHPKDAAPISSRIRALTAWERGRIQTFPPGFEWTGTKTDIEQMIGNAVPVELAKYVALAVRTYVADSETPSLDARRMLVG